MAKTHRCTATSTRFWFFAPAATRPALLLDHGGLGADVNTPVRQAGHAPGGS